MGPPSSKEADFQGMNLLPGPIAVGAYGAPAQTAVEALGMGARIAERLRVSASVPWMSKSDRSPVTAADYAVQAAVGRLLRKRHPALPMVAEEAAAALRVEQAAPLREAIVKTLQDEAPGASEDVVLDWIEWGGVEPPEGGPFWTLDPVDGTRGFLAARRYVVALALIDRGEVILGGLACPGARPRSVDGGRADDGGNDGVLALAVRGGGAWMTGLGRGQWAPMGVSDLGDAARSRVLVSAEPAHLDTGRLAQVSSLMGLHRAPTPMDSQVKYVLLAAGEFDLVLRLPRRAEKQKIWDFAAGVCIVEEAGGVVTDLEGDRLRFDSGVDLPNPPGVIASNGRLQAAALAAVAKAKKSAA